MLDASSRAKMFEDIPCLRQHALAVDNYLNYRRSARTYRLLYDRFETFIRWGKDVECNEGGRILRLPIDVLDVIRYTRALDDRGLSYATVRAYVSAIGTMHNIVEMYNPTADERVKAVLAELRAKQVDSLRSSYTLSEDDIRSILDNLYRPRRHGRGIETWETTQQRAPVDKALLLTMLQSGMRRSEASNLVWGDVRKQSDRTGRLLLREKRASERKTWVAITESCLQTLLAIKPEGANDDSRVFNMSDSQVNRRLKRMCEEAGIDPKNVSGHTPRASLARLMRDRGAPVWMIEQHLRHQPPPLMHADEPHVGEILQWLEETVKPTA